MSFVGNFIDFLVMKIQWVDICQSNSQIYVKVVRFLWPTVYNAI